MQASSSRSSAMKMFSKYSSSVKFANAIRFFVPSMINKIQLAFELQVSDMFILNIPKATGSIKKLHATRQLERNFSLNFMVLASSSFSLFTKILTAF